MEESLVMARNFELRECLSVSDKRFEPPERNWLGYVRATDFAKLQARPESALYGALDLGTNNCRLLIARPTHLSGDGYKIIDSFSRIVRLGEGLVHTGKLNKQAMERTCAALQICREKLRHHRVERVTLIATEACRIAQNGEAFIDWIRQNLGLEFEIVGRRREAELAVAGCTTLVDDQAEAAVLFDIGGGSCEIIWLAHDGKGKSGRLWASLKLGVVTLSEQFGGIEVTPAVFNAMIGYVSAQLRPFVRKTSSQKRCRRFHLLGTSGTITTLAGVHHGLVRYDRHKIDGVWLEPGEIDAAIQKVLEMSYEERIAHGCIGPGRADLVVAGCAIFQAIRRAFPCARTRVADRGLREGLLLQMMQQDGTWARA